MTAQTTAGRITDLELSDHVRIMEPAHAEIAGCLGIAIQLLAIEDGSKLKYCRSIGCRSSLRVEMGEALAKGQMAEQLNEANQIPTLAAAVAVEDILARVDIKRRPGLLVQRTEPDELGSTPRMTSPVMLLQILNQRRPPLECFDIFTHGAFLPPEPSVGQRCRQSQARMVGRSEEHT